MTRSKIRKTRHRKSLAPTETRIWSVHDEPVWDQLQQRESLLADPKLLEKRKRAAYDWMQVQLTHRVPGYTGGYPWWGWIGYKPDLRGWSRGKSLGRRRVLLELGITTDRLLVSDYHAWHNVLNECFLPLSEKDREDWYSAVDEAGLGALIELPEPWNARIRQSWDRVFDLEALAKGELWTPDILQVCFEELRLSDVLSVREFSLR